MARYLELAVLHLLAEHDASTTDELATHLDVEAPVALGVLQRLKANGWVVGDDPWRVSGAAHGVIQGPIDPES